MRSLISKLTEARDGNAKAFAAAVVGKSAGDAVKAFGAAALKQDLTVASARIAKSEDVLPYLKKKIGMVRADETWSDKRGEKTLTLFVALDGRAALVVQDKGAGAGVHVAGVSV